MSRITQDIANQIATKLLEKKKEAIDQALKDYRQLVMDEALKQTPKEVIDFFEKYPSFCKTSYKVYLDGHGFNRTEVKIPKNIPSQDGYYYPLKLGVAIANKIMALKRKHEKLSDDYTKAFSILENALINCRTFKNVEQNLPEAVPFLPKAKTMAVAVNYADVRKLIA